MKYLKYFIIIIVILVFILIIAISIISLNSSSDNTNEIIKKNETVEMSDKINTITNNTVTNNLVANSIDYADISKDKEFIPAGNVEIVTSANSFYMVQSCIQNYINDVVNKDADAIINQLSSEYIKKNNIEVYNVLQYVENISKGQEFRALSMKYVQGKVYNQYGVYGKLLGNSGKVSELYIVVNVNMNNLAYSIIPQLSNSYTNLSQLNIKEYNQEIVLTESNKATYKKITDEEIIYGIMEDYQKNVLYDTINAYNSIDYKYKNARFNDYSDYFKYAQSKVYQIQNMKLNRYKKTEYSNYNEYECEDVYGNVYIIKATGIREYTIILDNYTLESDSYKSEYATLDNTEKVKENVNKFIKMINSLDYTNCYNYLYTGFKDNYFKTQDDFESYIKQNFYSYNIVKSVNVTENDNGVYICSVILKNGNSSTEDIITKTIIMKLGTETNFEMSFEV